MATPSNSFVTKVDELLQLKAIKNGQDAGFEQARTALAASPFGELQQGVADLRAALLDHDPTLAGIPLGGAKPNVDVALPEEPSVKALAYVYLAAGRDERLFVADCLRRQQAHRSTHRPLPTEPQDLDKIERYTERLITAGHDGLAAPLATLRTARARMDVAVARQRAREIHDDLLRPLADYPLGISTGSGRFGDLLPAGTAAGTPASGEIVIRFGQTTITLGGDANNWWLRWEGELATRIRKITQTGCGSTYTTPDRGALETILARLLAAFILAPAIRG